MIRIKRDRYRAPEVLLHHGASERDALCRSFLLSPEDYRKGVKRFHFKKSIYADATVKDALCEIQHGKCCFCESKMLHVAFGDVEHFRPKAGYRQRRSDQLHRPGYYWLAYEWSTLLLCCEPCNRRHKRDLFPLRNPRDRARSHQPGISLEQPLFIDPGTVDPERFISFREGQVYAVGNNRIGKTTIETLCLDRRELTERRQHLYDYLRIFQLIAESLSEALPEELVVKARAVLRLAAEDSSEYCAMVRAALSNGFSAIGHEDDELEKPHPK